MAADKLIHMANQIASFMEARDGAGAAAGIAAHINDYWEPRMRREFLALIEAGAPDAAASVQRAAALVRPPPAQA